MCEKVNESAQQHQLEVFSCFFAGRKILKPQADVSQLFLGLICMCLFITGNPF